MLALALVLVVVGIVLLFFLTYVGVVVGIIGAILFICFLFGVGRETDRTQPHQF
jgi:ABC-type transporter Mla maintaining outer membrane lipid asymmetry permease subunit MlaE